MVSVLEKEGMENKTGLMVIVLEKERMGWKTKVKETNENIN